MRSADPQRARGVHDLDHLLWEARRLSDAERRFAERTGVAPVFGGRHAEGGTHNSLMSLGRNVYLEILALDPAHPRAAELSERPPPAFRPRLFAFGVRADDLAAVARLARAAGLEPSDPHEVARRTPDGERLAWRTLLVRGHAFGHAVPFFTRQIAGRHPSETAPQGCELTEFTVGHPDPAGLADVYEALRVDVSVVVAGVFRLRAVLETPNGTVVLD